jgi:PAS domain S-box-containing protein
MVMRALRLRSSLQAWVLGGCVALTQIATTSGAYAQSDKQVLILYSTRPDAQLSIIGETSLRRSLDDVLAENIAYFSEFIDVTTLSEAAYEGFVEFLRLKYESARFDLVVAIQDVAIDFVARHRDTLFRDTPTVFLTNSRAPVRFSNSTGLIHERNFAATVALLRQLQPEVRQLFIITGADPVENARDEAVVRELQAFESELTITYLSGLATKELEDRLSRLPEHSAVYYLSVSEDGAGQKFHPLEYLDRVVAVANAPTYCWVDSAIDHGIVGGSLYSQTRAIERVGEIAQRVLRGEPADSIPIGVLSVNTNIVDWRQLRRWGISEARVPAGTSVLFREPTLFEEYGGYIVGTIAVVVLQSALIGGLVIQRRRRHRAEASLRESEQHFRMMADTAPVMVWRTGPDKLCDFVNEPWLGFHGRMLEEELGNGWTQGVHPDDREYRTNTFEDAFARREPFRMEFRVRRADGVYRWLLDTGVPRRLPDGSFNGYIGSSIDITDRKTMEAALQANEAKLRARNEEIRDLAGRLITAQEVERSRIARELHDDIGQQVALITIELALLGRSSPDAVVTQTGEALRRVQDLARSVHDLSHRLHPARLRLLGLVSALEALRDELSKYGMEIQLTHENIPAILPADLTLCLFRVVQEGLQNALKHSRAHRVSVDLTAGPGALSLTIRDDGRGFDTDGALAKGLGLVSMHERLEAIGGSLEIRSTAGGGTKLKVMVPLGAVHSTGAAVLRVLLVDDNDAMLARAGEVLMPACVIAGKARSGKEALEAAEFLQPDVIVLDISMPDLTGFEVAAHLRQTGSTAAIVFLTVHDDDEYLRAAKAAGAVGYVVKSRLASDLLPAVHEARVRRPVESAIH